MNAEPPSQKPGNLAAWLHRFLGQFFRNPDERKQLISSIHDAESRHAIDPDTVAMMEGALLVSEMKVRDIMVPCLKLVIGRMGTHFGSPG